MSGVTLPERLEALAVDLIAETARAARAADLGDAHHGAAALALVIDRWLHLTGGAARAEGATVTGDEIDAEISRLLDQVARGERPNPPTAAQGWEGPER